MLQSLELTSVGLPITREGVSFFPVFIPHHGPSISTGPNAGVIISERPDAEVPTLQVFNPTGSPVLLVEGETLTGGRQTRTINVSVLVPAGATIDLPVSCIERGRWSGGREFGRGSMMSSRRIRRAKSMSVRESVQREGSKYSNQSAVWATVDHELKRQHLDHQTDSFLAAGAVFDLDERIGAATTDLIARGPLPGQCGVVIAHGRRVVAADVFASPELLAAQWEAVVRSALYDAPEEVNGKPSATKALQFLRKFAAGNVEVAEGAGLGREFHVSSRRVVGQALVWDNVLVHASVFATAA